MTKEEYSKKVIEAAQEYIRRQERRIHPDGEFDSCFPSFRERGRAGAERLQKRG